MHDPVIYVLLFTVVVQLMTWGILMAAIDTLTTSVTNAVTAINALIAKVQAAPADVTPQLTALAGQLDTAVASANAILNPPAPAPAPTPTA